MLGERAPKDNLKIWAILGLVLNHVCSSVTIYRIKAVDFRGIQTWIARVEGEHADHLTTATTAPLMKCAVVKLLP